MRDAFHEAAVADERVGVVVDELEARAVELLREQALGERHADRVREPLPERAGGRLDARRHAVLRVSRRHRAELAEALQLLDRQVVAGEVQQRVEQHRAVAVREHEAVAVGPLRVGRVVAQVPVPERDRDLGHAHRHARMSGVRRLHRVHGERADGVRHVALGAGIGFRAVVAERIGWSVRTGEAGEAAIIIGASGRTVCFVAEGNREGRFHRARRDGVPDGRTSRQGGSRGHGLQPHARQGRSAGWRSTAAVSPIRRRSAAAGAELVFSCVGDDPDLRAVTLGPDGSLRCDGEGRDPRRSHHRVGGRRARARGRSGEARLRLPRCAGVGRPVGRGERRAHRDGRRRRAGVRARPPRDRAFRARGDPDGGVRRRPAHQDGEPDLRRRRGAGPRRRHRLRPARRPRHEARAGGDLARVRPTRGRWRTAARR